MIHGGLVHTYGLRACPRNCAGRCALATMKGGEVKPSPDCELMLGPQPKPGTMPAFTFHSSTQLLAMASQQNDDAGARANAIEELRNRGE